ncbi:MAG: cytochrome c-type biogenesis protein CcmH [Betaproteobacteria bacterium]|nr:cytochrome c-type biogenesis protein CcmH [Betaproteobacteria bacterium]
MKSWLIAFVLLLAFGASGVLAKEAAPAAEDPVLERRVLDLSAELRCLVCQNQTLADSNAPLAVDLRNEIREQMKQGLNNREIVEFLVARYGDFVLFRPPFKATTLLLWLGPLLLLLAGLATLFFRLARRRAATEVELTEAERERAARLLESGPETGRR